LFVLGGVGVAAAQDPPDVAEQEWQPTHDHEHGQAPAVNAAQPAAPRAMMQMQAQMMERMRTADARLTELVANMKSARAQDAKVDAIEKLLTALVSEQASMHSQMMQLHDSMMKQMTDGSMQRTMMEHMQTLMGGMGGMDKLKPQPSQPAAPSPELPKP
jgi:hypothetical protein